MEKNFYEVKKIKMQVKILPLLGLVFLFAAWKKGFYTAEGIGCILIAIFFIVYGCIRAKLILSCLEECEKENEKI